MTSITNFIKTLSAGIFAASLMLSLSAYAAEEGDNSEIENEQATTAAEPGEASGTVEALPDIGLIEEAEEAETQQGGDTDFIPSVRITEDLPVAFPVDI